MNNEIVTRKPVTPEQVKQEIDDVFVFNPPISAQHAASCDRIQKACKELAQAIAEEVPEGKEQTIAINNLLSTALFTRHGITRRQVVVVAMVTPDTPSPEQPQAESPAPATST
jgi:hypothetical protein